MKALPQEDCREDGLLGLCARDPGAALALRDDVLSGHGKAVAVAAGLLLPLSDRLTRRWLERNRDPYRNEIIEMARLLRKPGVITLNLSYEWGCTGLVTETPDGPAIARILDWPYPGLGHRAVAAHLVSAQGPWTAITWHGVSSVLQASAPGRFAAAINQAPQPASGFGTPIDWLLGKPHFLRSRGMVPGHLLRQIFEQAPDYTTARRRLAETPLCAPVIYLLAGTRPGEGCIIERRETTCDIRDLPEPLAATNHWVGGIGGDRRWRARGDESEARRACAGDALNALIAGEAFDALPQPIRNPTTRLAMTATPATGAMRAQGWEAEGPVTLATDLPHPGLD